MSYPVSGPELEQSLTPSYKLLALPMWTTMNTVDQPSLCCSTVVSSVRGWKTVQNWAACYRETANAGDIAGAHVQRPLHTLILMTPPAGQFPDGQVFPNTMLVARVSMYGTMDASLILDRTATICSRRWFQGEFGRSCAVFLRSRRKDPSHVIGLCRRHVLGHQIWT